MKKVDLSVEAICPGKMSSSAVRG